jgi:hypothetical protein
MTVSNVFTLDVDIKEASYAYDRKITAKDNVTFIINLTNEGLPLDLSGVTTVSLANTRLDQVTVVTPGVKTGSNQVTFNLGQNETKNPGRVSAVVQLYDTNGRVSMLGFNYTVITDPTGELYIPQGDELTLIQVVLGDGPLVIEQARQATTNADSATADARTAIQNVTATINALNDNMDVAISNMNTNVNNNIATVNNDMKITHKGTVATYANLPTSNRQVGDTYVVTSDTTATNNGIWRCQSNSTWLKINNLNISGAETVSNVGVVAKAAADIARQTIMSGVLDYDSKVVDVRSMTIPKGGIGSNPTDASGNRLFLGASNASLNGYKVLLEGVNADKSNTITLPDPPTFGTRDDLVFLEAWFPSTGNGYELSWRIRTVVGVDFGKYVSDGITDSKGYGTTLGDPIVTPQGGNISSMSYDSTSSITRTITAFRRANVSDSILKFSDDVGLYIAGDGSQTSKDSLKTLDGYAENLP